jgi:hypothetical protein
MSATDLKAMSLLTVFVTNNDGIGLVFIIFARGPGEGQR